MNYLLIQNFQPRGTYSLDLSNMQKRLIHIVQNTLDDETRLNGWIIGLDVKGAIAYINLVGYVELNPSLLIQSARPKEILVAECF